MSAAVSAIEKVKFTTANEYAKQYGMSLVEAFVRCVASYAPSDLILDFDFDGFNSQRNTMIEEDRWMFDHDTIDALDSLFKNRMRIEYPESALTHMFPGDDACRMILNRAMSHVSRSERTS